MAQFTDVFSTTWKVVLALVLISAIIGAATMLLGGLGWVMGSAVPAPTPTLSSSTSEASATEQFSDDFRTSMPKSKWDHGMARAIKHHCFTVGMSKEEVAKALGDPSDKSESVWTWHLPPGRCLKYDGDACAEREQHQEYVFFTAKGNVRSVQIDCQSLNGDYIFNRDLFSQSPWTGEVGSSAVIARRAEAEAQSWQTQTNCEKQKSFVWKDGSCHAR